MKKHLQVIFVLIIYCLLFCFNDVFAFTTGEIYYKWNSSNNNFTGQIQNTNDQLATRSINLGTQIPINCSTLYCFATFETEFTLYQTDINSSNIFYQSVFIQVLVNDNNNSLEWNICENGQGLTTCMIKSGWKIQMLEIKYRNYGTNEIITYHIDMNNGTIFNSPSDVTAQLNNIQQQQQQQNQIVNNTDSSGNASDFNNVVNNATLPNNSHGFDILGSLQNFVSGIEVSGSCSRVSVPIPFTNQTLTLPCMTTDVYSVHFPEIVVIWQLLVRGLGYYYILVNILKLIKETIDPFNFKLEVMDL